MEAATAEVELTPAQKGALTRATNKARAHAAELAEAQAAKDKALWDALTSGEAAEMTEEEFNDLPFEVVEATPSEALRPLNRAERRGMVAQFKANLRALPRALPVRNPTIIPKSKRRKRRK